MDMMKIYSCRRPTSAHNAGTSIGYLKKRYAKKTRRIQKIKGMSAEKTKTFYRGKQIIIQKITLSDSSKNKPLLSACRRHNILETGRKMLNIPIP